MNKRAKSKNKPTSVNFVFYNINLIDFYSTIVNNIDKLLPTTMKSLLSYILSLRKREYGVQLQKLVL